LKVDGAENRNNTIHHNIYASGGVVGASAGEGSLTTSPGLVAPSTGDLHLGASSPARGAGAPLPANVAGATDIDGDPRGADIGADQH
ncbi:MAG TPA: hypothetical protein VLT33_40785, partial [Labilithrix sp.]|nr:hypothetical protein [Labilithrix sp.]